MGSLASKVAIANMALTGLGADRIISLTEDSVNAKHVNAVFDLLRDEVQRNHPWNFNQERREFAKLAATPAFGFSSFFQIPGDVLRILSPETKDIKFQVEKDRIATDEDEFKCLCLVRITDTTQWSTDFVTAFSARLEAELAFPITNSRSLGADKFKVYLDKIKLARGTDTQEGTPLEFEIDEWFDAREEGAFVPRAKET